MATEAHEAHTGSHGPGGSGHGGGGHEEHEGAPEWLISFADNVTLMMGFFVIMLAMTMKAAQEVQTTGTGEGPGTPSAFVLDTILSIREGFNRPVELDSSDPREQLLVRRLRQRDRGEADDAGISGTYDQSQSLRQRQIHAACGLIYFRHDAAEFQAQEQATIRGVAKRFKGIRSFLDIRGHVSTSEAAGLPDRGLKLASDRAHAVARALVQEGLMWGQLRVVACGDSDRIREHAYEESEHALNRRVEIVTTDEIVPEYIN